jgi:hypothetical protein
MPRKTKGATRNLAAANAHHTTVTNETGASACRRGLKAAGRPQCATRMGWKKFSLCGKCPCVLWEHRLAISIWLSAETIPVQRIGAFTPRRSSALVPPLHRNARFIRFVLEHRILPIDLIDHAIQLFLPA